MTYTQKNPDRVTPPVLSGGGAGLVVAVAARSIIDRYVNPADRELWWNLFQALLFALPAIGAWLGSLRARQQVTPVLTGDTPRDLEGRELRPVDHRHPGAGYPGPTTYGGAHPADGP